MELLGHMVILGVAQVAQVVNDTGSIPGSGRSPGAGHGYPLQYSCLENPMDRGVWWAMGSQRVGHDWATEHAHADLRIFSSS